MRRSSRSRTKNTAWDFAPQHRSAGVKQEASNLHRGAFGSLIVPFEDDDADVDEAAAALLAMSCPQQLPKAHSVTSPLGGAGIFAVLVLVENGQGSSNAPLLVICMTLRYKPERSDFSKSRTMHDLYLKPGQSV